MAEDKQIKNVENKKDERIRNWSFIVYPESAPKNWRDILDDEHVSWVESPLHDKDTDGDGEIKKEHWHILIMYDGKKSFDQIKAITDKLNAPIPQKAASSKGLVRYMIHMDNPEKYQYSRDDIICHGGADVTELLKPTSANRYELIREMVEYIHDNDITQFIDLAIYAQTYRPDDWNPILIDHNTLYIKECVKSMWFKKREDSYDGK